MAVIWKAVFHLPKEFTFTALWAASEDAAAHSRRADMVISRLIMMATGRAMACTVIGRGGDVASRTRAVATITLSATGSRKAPNWETSPSILASCPSAQSVRDASMKVVAARNEFHSRRLGTSFTKNQKKKGTITMRANVRTFGMVHTVCATSFGLCSCTDLDLAVLL